MTFPIHDIQRRLSVSLALERYMRFLEGFQRASKEVGTAGDELSTLLVGSCRFVTEINFQHYLVMSDPEGNFEIERIDCL